MDRPNKDMTVQQLRRYIRQTTKEVNAKYAEYVKNVKKGQGEINEALEREHERLYRLGKMHPDMTGRIGDVSEKKIGAGVAFKRKNELLLQARALEQFNNVDAYTPEYERQYDESERAAYSTFIQNNNYGLDTDNFSIDEYHNLVETLGALGEKVDTFGYAEIMSLYLEVPDDKRADVVAAAIEVMREFKGKGYTQKRALKSLRRKLDL